jgi:colanic acid/amylovoran biosynthesis glycosyltransferase
MVGAMGQPVTASARAASSTVDTRRIAHVIPEYLPRSATFVHTLLGHQTRSEAFVFAEATSNLDEFPIAHVRSRRAEDGEGRPAASVPGIAAARRSTPFARWVADAVGPADCALIHAHFGWSGRDSVAAASRLSLPLVTTFYGRDLSEKTRARRRDPYRRLFREGTLFVVEGPVMAQELARIGCDPRRIRVAPIGIAVDALAFAPRGRSKPLIVVQSGRFVEKKGFDTGLRAFAKAQPELGESELWLIGDGPLRAELESLVAELGLTSSVRFAGMVSHDEYRALVSRTDICLQPSRTAADGDSEGGAPTVILEAQALGIPVVATRHADIPFVVPRPLELAPENDVEAVAETLVAVALETERDRRDRLEEARTFVAERHAADVTAAAVEAIYDEALA